MFSPDEPGRYRDLIDAMLNRDVFMVTADFDSYNAKQDEVAAMWGMPERWWRTSILNIAGMGWFSSDRTIGEYASEIWHVGDRSGAADSPSA